MDLKALDASSAYKAVLGRNEMLPNVGDSAAGAISGGSSFASVLKSTVANVSESVANSDQSSVAALNGNKDLINVVTEVSNAEMVVESVVAVRDRVIQAYQEIIKMPI